jgi:hypothetical protein
MSSAREWERRIKHLARHTPQEPEALAALAEAAREQDAGDLAVARVKGLLAFGDPGCIEDVEHRALVLWVEQEGLRQWPKLAWLHHSPNEAAYRGQTGKGVRPGWPDFVLPVRARAGRLVRTDCVGLAMELKGPGGTLSREQVLWLAWLEHQGWYTATPYGFEAARDLLVAYLREAL